MCPTRKVPYSKGMSPRTAARWALVCALLIGGTIARADRRPVAVINLSQETQTREIAAALDGELAIHPDLRSLPNTTASALLEYTDDDRVPIDTAKIQLGRAISELGDVKFPEAIKEATEGERALWTVSPAEAAKLYADLSLVIGQAYHLASPPNDKEAAAAFALTSKLDPRRVLDPVLYPPDVRDAYKAASAASAATGTLSITGAGTAWIDGQEVGTAPGTFTTSPGTHVVWLTGMERETRGAAVVVDAGRETAVAIPDVAASDAQKLQRARLALSRATDAFTRAAAMKHLADLANVHDAILLSTSGGKVIVQTWRDRAPGFSALRERGNERPIDLLAPLAPPKKIAVEPPIRVVPPIVEKRWYQRNSVRAGIAIGIVSAIVGGIVWANAGPGFQPWNRDITRGGTLGR